MDQRIEFCRRNQGEEQSPVRSDIDVGVWRLVKDDLGGSSRDRHAAKLKSERILWRNLGGINQVLAVRRPPRTKVEPVVPGQ
jgi:hypothetical protein